MPIIEVPDEFEEETDDSRSLSYDRTIFNVPDDIREFLEIEDCSNFEISRYYLTEECRQIYDSILRTEKIAPLMLEKGMVYMNSTLLYGPPGTGKTTLARWLAYSLDVPFAYINYSKMLGGIMGSTSANISKVFRFMKDHRCIFMMDELDCVATRRGNEAAATGGELSRITITIMQEMDRYRRLGTKCILLAASNRADLLDKALLSRFSISHELAPLNNKDKEEYIKLYLTDAEIKFDPQNIKDYCLENLHLTQRNVESDIIRCTAEWVESNQIDNIPKDFCLYHID